VSTITGIPGTAAGEAADGCCQGSPPTIAVRFPGWPDEGPPGGGGGVKFMAACRKTSVWDDPAALHFISWVGACIIPK
jgi:hypothetical protein